MVLYVVPSPFTVAESPSAVYVLTELILKEEVLKLFLGARRKRKTSVDGREAERRKGERTDPSLGQRSPYRNQTKRTILRPNLRRYQYLSAAKLSVSSPDVLSEAKEHTDRKGVLAKVRERIAGRWCPGTHWGSPGRGIGRPSADVGGYAPRGPLSEKEGQDQFKGRRRVHDFGGRGTHAPDLKSIAVPEQCEYTSSFFMSIRCVVCQSRGQGE